MIKKINVALFFFYMLLLPVISVAEDSLPKALVTPISCVPEGYEIIPDSIKMSNDLRHIAFSAHAGNTQNIIQINNQTSPVYYAVQPGSPTWSPDSQYCAYIAYKSQTEAVVAINNDVVIERLDNADNFIFSDFGSRYAFRAQKNKRQFVVVDGKPGKAFDGIPVKDNFTFSPDGKRFFYVALKDNVCVPVVDGQEIPLSFNLIESVRFSPDSKHYAFKARIESIALGKGKWCVVNDGKKEKTYDQIFDLVFSNDSRHLSYPVVKDGKMMIVFNGQEMDPQDIVGLPVFSPDSTTFAHAFAKNSKWYVMLNDQKGDPFDQIYKFYFSPNSKNHAFFARDKDKWHCVVNGKRGHSFEKGVDVFKFSWDSSRYVFAGVDKNGSCIVTDGDIGKKYRSVGEPYFSPDSRHIVYRAIRPDEELWITVLNGKESKKKYIGIGQYQFTADSKHLIFPAATSIDQSLMVVDDVEQLADHEFKILGDPYFGPDGNYIVYYARAGEEAWHLVINGNVIPETYGGFFKGTPIVFDSPTRFHTLGIKPGGTEFIMIDVNIPETLKLTSGINEL